MTFYFVYILKCADGTYYTGFTSDLHIRFEEHQKGTFKNSYTYSRRPVSLVFFEKFTNPNLVIATEKQLKKWSKAKKEALISKAYHKLPDLAKKKTFN